MSKLPCIDPAHFPIELRVILYLLRKFFSQGERNMENVPMEGIDWDLFLSLAFSHRVSPFVYADAEVLAEMRCPERVLHALCERSEKITWNNLILAGELVRLTDLFQGDSIPVIAIKGTAQALLLYRNLELRSSSDIDLLISPHNLEKAHHVLLNAGYAWESRYPRHSLVRAAIQSVTKELMYRHRATGMLVELHWRLTLSRSVCNPRFDTVLANAQVVIIGDREVLTLSDVDMVLFLLFHGALHGWSCLMWVCDVARVFRITEPFDWGELLARASRLGVPRSVTFGLVVSNLLVGSPLPHEVSSLAEKEPSLHHLIQYVIRCLLKDDTRRSHFAERLGSFSYQVRLERSLTYKMEVLLNSPIKLGLVAAAWGRARSLLEHKGLRGGL